jgi:hypothetical protein
MPTIITLGAASAKGFGYGAASKGNYWILKVNEGFYSGLGVDSSNNIYLSGQYAPGNTYATLYKFSTLGAKVYSKGVRTSFYIPTNLNVGFDSSGYIYCMGVHNDGSGTPKASLVRYDSSGNSDTAKQYSNVVNTMSDVVSATDSSGNTIWSGSDYLQGIFVKINSSGTTQFSKDFGNTSARAYDMKIVGSNYYLFGRTAGGGSGDFLVIKTDTSGSIVWQKSKTNSNQDTTYPTGNGGCVDSSGNVYLFGRAQNSTNTSYFDLVLIKYNSSGTFQFSKRISVLYSGNIGYGASRIFSECDSDGNVYYATTFTDGGVSSTGYYRVEIGCINSSGDVVWSNKLYQTSYQYTYCKGLKIDSTGNLIVSFNGNVMAVAKLPKDGSLTGVYDIFTYEQGYRSTSSYTLVDSGSISFSDYSRNPSDIVNTVNETLSITTNLVSI